MAKKKTEDRLIKLKNKKGEIVEIPTSQLPKFLAEQAEYDGIMVKTSILELKGGPTASEIRESGSSPVALARQYPTNILTQGLRAAKTAIANILKDEGNLEMLATRLKEEFDADPAAFLRMYEPMLAKYEVADEAKEDVRRPLHVIVTGEATFNMSTGKEKTPLGRDEVVIDATVISTEKSKVAPLSINTEPSQ